MNDKIIRDYLAKQNNYPTSIDDISVLYPLAKGLIAKVKPYSRWVIVGEIKASFWYEKDTINKIKAALANAITFINEQQ